jgi:hypothetical protein
MNESQLRQLMTELFKDNKFKNPFEIIKTAIYINPEQFDYISADNFTKEEYKELEELAKFLKI